MATRAPETRRAEEPVTPITNVPAPDTDILDAGSVHRRALRGVLALGGREYAMKLLSLGGGILLARLLDPAAFGLFAIAAFVISLFTLFSELGLGAAFIRKPDGVSPQELNALFTFQLVFVSLLAAVIFLGAPLAAQIYHTPEVIWLVRAVSITLVLTSLRSVPLILAERNLAYGPVALADVSGQVAYWLVAIGMALAGMGVWSLVAATVASGLVGTALLYSRIAWRPRLEFRWRPLRASLHFGVLYQAQSATHFAKDVLVPSLGGWAYGTTAVGYLSWALQLAQVPLQLTQLVSRVSYPALARLQHDRPAYLRLVETTLRWTCRVSLPIFAVFAGLAPQIIEYVYGAKWLPALPALYLLYINMVLGIATGVLMPALYSIGRVGPGLRISLIWMGLTWLIAAGLVVAGAGFAGIAAAYSIATVAIMVPLVVEIRKIGPVDLLGATWWPLLTAVIVGGLLYLMAPLLVHNFWTLGLAAALGAGAGLAANLWSDRAATIRALQGLLNRTKRVPVGTPEG
jgi:teichuronic acid exporter